MKMTPTRMVIGSAILFVLLYNIRFFHGVVAVYPPTVANIGFLISLAVGLAAVIVVLLRLFGSRYTTKPLLMLLFILSSLAAYFMDNYQVVIDHTMIKNIVQTDVHEAADLMSSKLFVYLLLLGILPSIVVWRLKLSSLPWKKALLIKLRDVVVALLVILGLVIGFSKHYTSFFREHKPLRYTTNPTYYIYSLGKYIGRTFNHDRGVLHAVGTDAQIPATDLDRELVFLVVGEAARADHFSLNGYGRRTNPNLEAEDVVSFTKAYSCGTSTAYSVPCMFSVFPRKKFNDEKGETYENLLDVLTHAGVNVLWRDNNSSSKGVARRVVYQDYKKPTLNPMCDSECRDEGMLVGLQEYIDSHSKGDILIVLHQMGNHGPAYYKRYPLSFEKFTPVCRTNQIEKCTTEEINNAYDNAILYTDYFLFQAIDLLKKNTDRFETALIYMSDHGESLGEYGVYLHGLPYSIAPEVQKHVAALFWFGDSFHIDRQLLDLRATESFSHDNLFHTVLGLMEIQTLVYEPTLDIFAKPAF